MKVVSPATETLTTTTTTTNLEERVHVLDAHLNVWTVITEIATSGLQEEAFYVCDIGDIVRKYKLWNTVLPRVKPYYGKRLFHLLHGLLHTFKFVFTIRT